MNCLLFPRSRFSLEWEPFCSSLDTQMDFEICPIDPCFEGVPADVVGFIFSLFRSRRPAKTICRRGDSYKRFLPPLWVQEILRLLSILLRLAQIHVPGDQTITKGTTAALPVILRISNWKSNWNLVSKLQYALIVLNIILIDSRKEHLKGDFIYLY